MANATMVSVIASSERVSNRTLANRRNALKSTGPRTAEGKANSRRNAVKHGLAGRGVVLPAEVEADARKRTQAWIETIKPVGQVETEFVVLAATTLSQVFHCRHEETLARANLVDRAERLWDVDRDAEITELAKPLSKEPERVVSQLKRSAHGSAWLLERWEAIAMRLEAGDEWTEEMRTYAFDLLAVPEVFRDHRSPFDRPGATAAELVQIRLDVVRDQIQTLKDTIDEHLIEVDEDERSLRMADLSAFSDPHVSKLLRYDQALTRRLMTLMRTIRRPQFGASAACETKPTPPPATHDRSTPPSREQAIRTAFPEISKVSDDSVLPFSVGKPSVSLAEAMKKQPSHESILPAHFESLTINQLEAAALSLDQDNTEQLEAMTALIKRKLFEHAMKFGV